MEEVIDLNLEDLSSSTGLGLGVELLMNDKKSNDNNNGKKRYC